MKEGKIFDLNNQIGSQDILIQKLTNELNSLKVRLEEMETEICAICLDLIPLEDMFISVCGHKFHRSCERQNFRFNENCPICRTHVVKGRSDYIEDDVELIN